jgi:hypothetical protein
VQQERVVHPQQHAEPTLRREQPAQLGGALAQDRGGQQARGRGDRPQHDPEETDRTDVERRLHNGGLIDHEGPGRDAGGEVEREHYGQHHPPDQAHQPEDRRGPA